MMSGWEILDQCPCSPFRTWYLLPEADEGEAIEEYMPPTSIHDEQ